MRKTASDVEVLAYCLSVEGGWKLENNTWVSPDRDHFVDNTPSMMDCTLREWYEKEYPPAVSEEDVFEREFTNCFGDKSDSDFSSHTSFVKHLVARLTACVNDDTKDQMVKQIKMLEEKIDGWRRDR